MSTIDPNAWQRQIRPIIGALRTPIVRSVMHEAEPQPAVPFITISREAGAGGWQIAQRLVERLNEVDPGETPWTGWDRELVEKVAADHNLSRALVESLLERDQNWLSDFLDGLAVTSEAPSEETIFRDVSTTARALAQAGRVVIVGLGGVYITAGMPRGVHVRLVAPLEQRIASIASRRGLERSQAEAEVRRLERNRQAFFARHWPDRPLAAEAFDLTLNAGRLSEEQMVQCIVPLISRAARSSRLRTEAVGI